MSPRRTPPASLAVLRAAFDRTMADKQFLDDAEKMRIDISPMSGQQVQDLVRKIYTSPKDIVERAKMAIR